ncbi:nuclear transcription factor Y, beta [Puccinia sorghi]|uniref:Nuclear transcription factor Y, beta n=1 Tax=Puccinia sorghi TaxID=27349 RepID=A0A0L6UCN0_9BASI|nr:nuclear transcription factor Y, beta [Puccinia sorghi]
MMDGQDRGEREVGIEQVRWAGRRGNVTRGVTDQLTKRKIKMHSSFPTASLSVIAPHPTTTETEANQNETTEAQTMTGTTRCVAPIEETEVDSFNPQHLLLPLSNISKLMKASVPLDSKISNTSKLMVQSCVSEMISFVAAEANDQVLAEKRRTLNGVDLLCAFKRLGFDAYYEALQIYLAKYRTGPSLCFILISKSIRSSPL